MAAFQTPGLPWLTQQRSLISQNLAIRSAAQLRGPARQGLHGWHDFVAVKLYAHTQGAVREATRLT